MLSGRLNHKLRIEQRTETKNTLGEDITTWTLYKETWGHVSPLSGKEYISQNELQSSVTGRISIRYISGITTDMRVNWNDRIFDILSVINTDERNRELIMIVEEQL